MTHKTINKACIYGAGAIGGWIGAGLAAAGCSVSVVARGATLEALNRHGLRVASGTDIHSAAVQTSADPAALGVQDLVVIAVKAPALLDVARQIAPLIGPDTLVLTAMNGVPWWFFQGFGGPYAGTQLKAVDATGEIAAAIPAANIIGCVVHASCSVDAPGVIRHHFGNGLIIGEPSGAQSPRVQALAELLVRAGFAASVSAQIQKDAWYKLWGNMTVNPISAFTGATTDRILGDELVRDFISKIMLEAKEIGARIGIPIAQQPEDRHAVTLKLGAFKTSMLQDVEAGKAVELDALVTVVKELGKLTQVPTPFTDALLGLARLHARVHGLYP
ncbi:MULTISPECIES: 2-dehydropantoate 2-reductase [unclassified Polaromonas]|jgi:2-dehydropantoate 2-reductase|uniref:2-dehydropantoate 2-reductase n=1 Tax=unclassified Polaromonas TaxID=2638319 RepID=UPI000BDC1CC1|nr:MULTISPECIES: 2-dehydropantoate 2-reductase [unclassified Polaromonas]OYY38447.1 MAG: 2-dehydropantoate 2-reductase [Polaromonas sp. 35-63-35]OYZ21395.1 MAG: 2-dehydropantoate 2-reductase [Polaromonas sp. 16-63-31]OYZ79151.1 MAG: 2-dehydropantoate 2-reductase [Polaromonas sp. 24-63-21]OZA50185.1 MAG: 2-dehydropantoate 2-reductase [Polaromonas sp. 17-63-33]OZA89320.1 MAG: 2-dehydropantoate 2-reductase [Polaromonas sp. 39-63-25]